MVINSWLLWFISAEELETQKSDREEQWKKEWKGRWSVSSLTSPPVPSTLGYRWGRGVLTAGMVSVLFLGVLNMAEQSLAKGWPLFSSLYHTPCSMAVATCSLSASSGPSDHRPERISESSSLAHGITSHIVTSTPTVHSDNPLLPYLKDWYPVRAWGCLYDLLFCPSTTALSNTIATRSYWPLEMWLVRLRN